MGGKYQNELIRISKERNRLCVIREINVDSYFIDCNYNKIMFALSFQSNAKTTGGCCLELICMLINTKHYFGAVLDCCET